MQKKILPVLFAATLLASGTRAQDAATGAPAPAAPTPAPSQAAPASPAPAAQAAPQMAPVPNQVIYSPRLPSPHELTSAAAAQGMTVDQISQSASQVTVVYRFNNGQTNTVAYQLLPTAAQPTPVPTTIVVPSQAPTVIYEQAPRVVYYETYEPYYPRYYYPPVSFGLGFGYYHGWGGGHWGGGRGYYGGHHWR